MADRSIRDVAAFRRSKRIRATFSMAANFLENSRSTNFCVSLFLQERIICIAYYAVRTMARRKYARRTAFRHRRESRSVVGRGRYAPPGNVAHRPSGHEVCPTALGLEGRPKVPPEYAISAIDPVWRRQPEYLWRVVRHRVLHFGICQCPSASAGQHVRCSSPAHRGSIRPGCGPAAPQVASTSRRPPDPGIR
jgi:hypothetical protein